MRDIRSHLFSQNMPSRRKPTHSPGLHIVGFLPIYVTFPNRFLNSRSRWRVQAFPMNFAHAGYSVAFIFTEYAVAPEADTLPRPTHSGLSTDIRDVSEPLPQFQIEMEGAGIFYEFRTCGIFGRIYFHRICRRAKSRHTPQA